MENTLTKQWVVEEQKSILSQIIFGCCFIIFCSYIYIPFYPVPFTLQVFAVALLGLTQAPKVACASVISFLVCASCDLPVFLGGSNALWILGRCGGYLVAFPIAAYAIARISQKWSIWVALCCGYSLIYMLGMVWLVPLIGMKLAFLKGVLLFIPADLVKGVMAIGIARLWKSWRYS